MFKKNPDAHLVKNVNKGKTCPQRPIRALPLIDNNFVKGSLTIEASLATPIFMLFFMALISFLVLINLQLGIQSAMDETARSIGKKAFLLSYASASSKNFDEDTKTLMSVGINPTSLKVWLLTNGKLKGSLEKSRIIGKSGGLYTYESKYEEESGILDMLVHYDYSFPWVPESFGKLRLLQRMRSHVWIGNSLTKKSGAVGNNSEDTVYVTQTGTVYHTDKACHYLDLSIHSTSTAVVSSQRNLNGAKYERCTGCTKAGYSGNAYITDYGTNWHSSLSCSGLKRTIIEVDVSDIGDMRECSKCSGRY